MSSRSGVVTWVVPFLQGQPQHFEGDHDVESPNDATDSCFEANHGIESPHVAADSCFKANQIDGPPYHPIDYCVEVIQVVDSLHNTFDCSTSIGIVVEEGGDSSVVGGVAGGEVKQGVKRMFMDAYVEVDGLDSLIHVKCGRMAEDEWSMSVFVLCVVVIVEWIDPMCGYCLFSNS